MRDHRVYLKVKIKSLAEEARIIRREERKNPKARAGLSEHRRGIVRSAARHTLLAYGFLRGREYPSIEPNSHFEPNWAEVWRMVDKYGAQQDYSGQESWHDYKKRKAEQEERFKSWKKRK